jgi:hypothetical protein
MDKKILDEISLYYYQRTYDDLIRSRMCPDCIESVEAIAEEVEKNGTRYDKDEEIK